MAGAVVVGKIHRAIRGDAHRGIPIARSRAGHGVHRPGDAVVLRDGYTRHALAALVWNINTAAARRVARIYLYVAVKAPAACRSPDGDTGAVREATVIAACA